MESVKSVTLHFELRTLQKIVGTWGDTTFPLSEPASIARHMAEEVSEIEDAILGVALHSAEDVPDEAADLVLLLMHLAHKLDFDLWDAVERKFDTNQHRAWENQDATAATERGYWKHTEGETE